MSEWISVEDRLPEQNDREVDIAFWDGTYMCRIYGAYDHDAGAWYVGQMPLIEEDTPEWKVTHWKYPTPLPEPPEGS